MGSSPDCTKAPAVKRPDVTAFWEEAALPASVTGPADDWALAALAASWAEVAMSVSFGVRVPRVSREFWLVWGGGIENEGKRD
jgi:hypothetical protein